MMLQESPVVKVVLEDLKLYLQQSPKKYITAKYEKPSLEVL